MPALSAQGRTARYSVSTATGRMFILSEHTGRTGQVFHGCLIRCTARIIQAHLTAIIRPRALREAYRAWVATAEGAGGRRPGRALRLHASSAIFTAAIMPPTNARAPYPTASYRRAVTGIAGN